MSSIQTSPVFEKQSGVLVLAAVDDRVVVNLDSLSHPKAQCPRVWYFALSC